MKNENEPKIKNHRASFEDKEHRGVEYTLWQTTQDEAEIKIKNTIDKMMKYNERYFDSGEYKIEVICEASESVIIDLWVFKSIVTYNEFEHFERPIVNRIKHPELKKYGYRVRGVF